MSEFNWKQFHQDLDTALAILISESDLLPSKTTLMEFLELSNAKATKQGVDK